MGYSLIGTEASQFTGKARSHLQWKGVAFTDVAATPEVYRDIIEPRIGFATIPILLTPAGQIVQDTADIFDHIEREAPGPSAVPPGAVQKLVALLMELYADEWLLIPAMHYRWTYSEPWILEELGRIAAPRGTRDEQTRFGQIAAERIKATVPKLGVTEETSSGIEAHYEGFLADFSAHLRRSPFLFGTRPSLGDFALFGPLNAPLYRDPALGEQMRRLAPLVVGWVERMQSLEPQSGEFLPDDEVPELLHPLLKRQMTEQLPVLVDSAARFGEWAISQPSGARIPRGLGTHEFTIGGRRGERTVMSFSLWRLQRVLDHYNGLSGADRARADGLLDAIGGRAISGMTLPRRLERREYRIVPA